MELALKIFSTLCTIVLAFGTSFIFHELYEVCDEELEKIFCMIIGIGLTSMEILMIFLLFI